MPPSPTDTAATIAARLLGAAVDAIEVRRGGGNNRVFRVVSGGHAYALKEYPSSANDPRDRLGHEFGGLTFMRAHGIAAVPKALGADRRAGYALYEWVEGTPVATHTRADLARAAAFLAELDAASRTPEAHALPAAAEAVFVPAELDAQIAARFARFDAIAGAEPLLAELLAEIRSLWRPRSSAEPAVERRTLSPSDFGFHNALRRPGGELIFLDFEYFGWDDPVKLVCDTIWHPGTALDADDGAAFAQLMRPVYGDDPGYEARFARDLPRYGLRWALIVLNEFLPAAWERRRAAGRPDDWAVAKAEQAAKSRALLERVRALADRS